MSSLRTWTTFFAIVMVCVHWTVSTVSLAHEYPDGFIERGIEIQVRDQIMHIEYSIGLSPATMQSIILEWQKESSNVAINSNLKIENDLPPRPRKKEFTEAEIQELESQFSKLIQVELVRRLKVELEGKRVPASAISVEVAPRHHVNSVIQLQVNLPDVEQLKLLVDDPTFDHYDGVIRTALKAKGRAMIMNSNVAPILVRAKRLELSGLSPKSRTEVSQISVKLGFRPVRNTSEKLDRQAR